MNQKQQRILMRSGLAMGVTLAVGMLAFGQVTGAPRTDVSPGAANVEGAPAAQVTDLAAPEPDLILTEAASAAIVSEVPVSLSQEFSRVARNSDYEDHEDHEDEDEHEERRESSRISEHRERR